MPADFDDVGDRLSRLQGDSDRVEWAGADDVRARGRQRGRHRAMTGTLVVCLGIGALGISITGNLPGQEGFLNNTVPIAGIPTEDRTVPPSPSEEGVDRDGDGEPDPPPGSTDPSEPGANDPSKEASPGVSKDGTPTEENPASPTSPDDPDPTDPSDPPTSSPTDPPTTPEPVDPSVVPTPSEMPSVDETGGPWTESGSGDGEGSGTSRWLCAKSDLAGLGATSVAWRDFAWGSDSTVKGYAATAGFPSGTEAQAAYDSLASSVAGCSSGTSSAGNSVGVSGGTAQWWRVEKSAAEVQFVGVVRRGSALTYVLWQDSDVADATYSGDSMGGTLEAAASRLAPWSE